MITNILEDIGIPPMEFSPSKSEKYEKHKNMIDRKLPIFDKKPYQLGSLDDEIFIIYDLLANFNKPSVLEIGVANGYSSSFLYLVSIQKQ